MWAQQHVQSLTLFREEARRRNWQAFLFGGVPRGLWINGTAGPVRDFDIVVHDDVFDEVLYTFRQNLVHKNRFGGVKLTIQDCEFDVWPLSRTWAFREGLFEETSFATLPNTTFLNIDSIVIELAPRQGTKRRVFEGGFFRAMRDRRLDILLEKNPFPELCAIRSLRIAQTLGFSLTVRLAKYIQSVVIHSQPEVLKQTQLRHYGRQFFDQSELLKIAEQISLQLSNLNTLAVNLFAFYKIQTYLWKDWCGEAGGEILFQER